MLVELPPVLGPYRLIRKLGRGGFASVWLAEESYEGVPLREVALKLFQLPPEVDPASEDAARWREGIIDEAGALCRVEHPHVVRFYALHRDDARGLVGLATEYVPGESLDIRLQRTGPLGLGAVIEAGIDVALALAAVHRAGLAHRDVKPANIVQCAGGHKLIDFGIALERSIPADPDARTPLAVASVVALDPAAACAPTANALTTPAPASSPANAATDTAAFEVVGTLGYIAPECLAAGAPSSPASDLYALGVTLFVLLAGVLPLDGRQALVAASIAAGRRLAGEPPSPAEAELSRLLSRLLEPDPAARPRHADWVARELERAAALLPASDGAAREQRVDARAPRIAPAAGRRAAGAPAERPPLVGRAPAVNALAHAAAEARQGRGARIALVTGPLGIGRTRLIEAAVEQAGYSDGRVLRLACSPERRSPFGPLLRSLAGLPLAGDSPLGLVIDAIERVVSPEPLARTVESSQAVEDVEEALLWASVEVPLLLAVDDLQWADAHTLDLLRLLIESANAGATARLFVVAAARDEPSPSPPLRKLLAQIRARGRAVVHLPLAPLSPAETASLVRAAGPAAPEVEQAVVRGAGGVPFFVLHTLRAWSETGAVAWSEGAWRARDGEALKQQVPGVADLVEAQLAAFFEPGSAVGRAALRALAAVALHGGGLGIEALLAAVGDAAQLEDALEALVGAGMLTASGEPLEYGFAQEMVRQAALNMARGRPWFFRLHRALLDAVAAGRVARADAAFLATGYEALGADDLARLWLARAIEAASAVGLFEDAAELAERLAALTEGPAARARIALDAVRSLIHGRKLEEARRRLARVDAGADPAADLRRRICWLEVARGLYEPGAGDPALLADVDALGDVTLRCEARIALAGVSSEESALALAGEAVALAEGAAPALEFAARVLRTELVYASSRRDLAVAERDLTRALSIARATGSAWQELHIEGDLAAVEAERGRPEAAIARVRRLAAQAESLGMRGQLRLFSQNLSALLLRQGFAAEAAATARRTAELAAEAGDPVLRATALSLRADALRRSGALDAALESIREAERLQRERGDRMRALTLLRRAEILGELGRVEEATADARAARHLARDHGEKGIELTAALSEKLHLARLGQAAASEVEEALAAAQAAGIAQRALTRSLMEQATAWLADPARTLGRANAAQPAR